MVAENRPDNKEPMDRRTFDKLSAKLLELFEQNANYGTGYGRGETGAAHSQAAAANARALMKLYEKFRPE